MDRILTGLTAAVLLLAGWLLARLLSRTAARLTQGRASAQVAMIAERSTYYGVLGLGLASALSELGVDLSVLLGAAGILSVAIGFASQTSASNLISGLFLLGERPFVVGDVVQVGANTGEVVSIDLLSVKMRTFDNLLLRVPNETLLKSDIKNLTHFPIRRYDLPVRVAYDADLAGVRTLLTSVADAHPLCLDEPRPLVLFLGFGADGMELQFSVWASTKNFLELRNTIPDRVKQAFDEGAIRIPLPQRAVHVTGDRLPTG